MAHKLPKDMKGKLNHGIMIINCPKLSGGACLNTYSPPPPASVRGHAFALIFINCWLTSPPPPHPHPSMWGILPPIFINNIAGCASYYILARLQTEMIIFGRHLKKHYNYITK